MNIRVETLIDLIRIIQGEFFVKIHNKKLDKLISYFNEEIGLKNDE